MSRIKMGWAQTDITPTKKVFLEGQDLAVAGVVKAITEAWKTRDDASFANAFDRAAVGMCRRVDYSDGTAQMWGNSNTTCLPTKKAEEHGHYSAMIASGTCGHEAGELLVRQILKDINQMFEK